MQVQQICSGLVLLACRFVDYHYVGNFSHPTGKPQLYIYDTCLQRYGRRHRFLAFFDCDEFLVINDAGIPDVPRLLRPYEAYGALAVNWQVAHFTALLDCYAGLSRCRIQELPPSQMFGSSGHLMRPEGGVLANYRACFPPGHGENRHIKTIANTQYTLRVGRDPHHFVFQEGMSAVNERFEPVNGAVAEVCTNQFGGLALRSGCVSQQPGSRAVSGHVQGRPATLCDQVQGGLGQQNAARLCHGQSQAGHLL